MTVISQTLCSLCLRLHYQINNVTAQPGILYLKMSYTNTRSTSRKRIPNDGTPYPLRELSPRVSAITEQRSTQDDCTQPSMLPFRPRSVTQVSVCSQADTICESQHWSASTLIDPEWEPHQIEYVVQALEPCSQRSPTGELAQPVPLSLSNLKVADVRIHCAMDHFLTEDPSETPLTAFNLRVSTTHPVQVSSANHRLSHQAAYVLFLVNPSLMLVTKIVSSDMFANDITIH